MTEMVSDKIPSMLLFSEKLALHVARPVRWGSDHVVLFDDETLASLQNDRKFTELMMLQEELKLYPFGDVWNYFCKINQVPEREEWYHDILEYENSFLQKR